MKTRPNKVVDCLTQMIHHLFQWNNSLHLSASFPIHECVPPGTCLNVSSNNPPCAMAYARRFHRFLRKEWEVMLTLLLHVRMAHANGRAYPCAQPAHSPGFLPTEHQMRHHRASFPNDLRRHAYPSPLSSEGQACEHTTVHSDHQAPRCPN